jgi:ubiquinol-cytochrome c reductase cytochrome b subunit
MGVIVFLALFSLVMFYAPTMGGIFLEAPNFQPANPMLTPPHIAPVWYFTPYYAMLRAVPPMWGSQFPGVVVMFGAILIFFALPWLDRSPVKSIRYKGPIFKVAIAIFAVSFIVLAWLGMQPASDLSTLLSQIFTALYFAFFLLMPIYSSLDKTKPVPERVTS